MQYYQKIDLPPIPQDLLNTLVYQGNRIYSLDYGRKWSRGGEEIFAPLFMNFSMPEGKLRDWILTHVPASMPKQSVFQTQTIGTHKTHCEMIPHVDFRRSRSLNYYIESGGAGSELVWYQENGRPIEREIRSDHSGFQPTKEGWFSLDDLTEVERVRCEPNCWYLIRTDIIHGVQNVTGVRKFISVY